jgi:hypothetical protein
MRGRTHEHKGAAHHPRKEHKHGGRAHKASGGEMIMKAGGNPEVEKEAEEKKHGGRARKHRKHGGHVEGHHSKHKMDRHHRKAGGRVGSDHSPLSSAHNTTSPEARPKSQEGGMST